MRYHITITSENRAELPPVFLHLWEDNPLAVTASSDIRSQILTRLDAFLSRVFVHYDPTDVTLILSELPNDRIDGTISVGAWDVRFTLTPDL